MLENVTRADGKCHDCGWWVRAQVGEGEVRITDRDGRIQRFFPDVSGLGLERLLSNRVHFALRSHRKGMHE